jgi:hypothetical protein
MICNKCGKDKEGRYVEIVTGNLLKSHIEGYGSMTISNRTYGEFQPLSLWFCQDCWRTHLREGTNSRLTGSAITFGVGLIVAVLGSLVHDSTFGGLGILAALLGLSGTIYNGVLRLRTNYSELNMQLSQPKSIFNEFKDLLPALVYKSRGWKYYWDAQTWQCWLEKKPNPGGGSTYQSKQ